MIRKLLALTVLSTLCSCAQVQDNSLKVNEVDALRKQGYSVRAITPIYSQLLTDSLPKGFVPVFVNTTGGSYIQESVLEGESVKNWSQMITVTGAKGLSSNPNVTPIRYASFIAGGFKRDCPKSFSATSFGEITIGIHDAFAAAVSCGISNPDGEEPYSESVLLIVVKGENDYYTIQWAERGDASETPIKFDNVKWIDRMKKLTPINLCPIIPGESAPYSSCSNRT
jgi:hypothetical protein